ncbi:MAG: hypothetical protein KKF56_02345 [Nanoarchaeota archaeon]|nr:hypothetical protein [Nanoarchaeota archaeon]
MNKYYLVMVMIGIMGVGLIAYPFLSEKEGVMFSPGADSGSNYNLYIMFGVMFLAIDVVFFIIIRSAKKVFEKNVEQELKEKEEIKNPNS